MASDVPFPPSHSISISSWFITLRSMARQWNRSRKSPLYFDGIVAPSSCGVGPSCSAQRVRDWFTQCVVPPLDRSLRDRLLTAASVLTVHHVDRATVSTNWGADPVVYGRSSSPSHIRFWGVVLRRAVCSSFGMRHVMCSVRSHRRLVPLLDSVSCSLRPADAVVPQVFHHS